MELGWIKGSRGAAVACSQRQEPLQEIFRESCMVQGKETSNTCQVNDVISFFLASFGSDNPMFRELEIRRDSLYPWKAA